MAIERYVRGVRADAPWCPSNIEFIRRVNGLDSVVDVKQIVYDAGYLVLGLARSRPLLRNPPRVPPERIKLLVERAAEFSALPAERKMDVYIGSSRNHRG